VQRVETTSTAMDYRRRRAGDLAPPEADRRVAPDQGSGSGRQARVLRALSGHRFRRLNRWLVVPIFRLGIGGLVFGDPLGGWLMVLRTRGRRSGRVREVGLDYVIHDGAIYCLAGFGTKTAWLRNLEAEPRVEVLLPGRTVSGQAEVVIDQAERALVIPKVVRAAGLASLTVDPDPWHADDARLLAAVGDVPLVRIRVPSLAAGPADPGGRLWVVRLGAAVLLTVLAVGRSLARH
jgi:deazaflavin-dependent oxidoreductase (nitroreductase family)